MSAIKKLLVGFGGLVLAIVLVGFALPPRIAVERSALVDAPPAMVFALLNGFRRFADWSPWAAEDGSTRFTPEGPVTGVGARLNWAGGPEIGTGRQEIVESAPHERIRVRLQTDAWDGNQWLIYELQREGQATLVTWRYEADVAGSLLGRYLGLFMEAGMGRDLERGLQRLEALVDGLPQGQIAGLEVEQLRLSALPLVYLAGTTSPDPIAIGTAYAVGLSRLLTFLHREKLDEAEPPILITRERDLAAGIYAYEVGIPVEALRKELPGDSEIKIGQSYGGLVLRARHTGKLASIAETHDALAAYAAVHGFERNGDSWEQRSEVTEDGRRSALVYLPVR